MDKIDFYNAVLNDFIERAYICEIEKEQKTPKIKN